MPYNKVFTKSESLESLFYVWGTKPIDHLFQDEIEQYRVDLMFANVTEAEYLEYARNHS